MRGWVGVQNDNEQKRLYAPSIQDFQGNGTLKPSAHFMGTMFQLFGALSSSAKRITHQQLLTIV